MVYMNVADEFFIAATSPRRIPPVLHSDATSFCNRYEPWERGDVRHIRRGLRKASKHSATCNTTALFAFPSDFAQCSPFHANAPIFVFLVFGTRAWEIGKFLRYVRSETAKTGRNSIIRSVQKYLEIIDQKGK